MHWQNNDPYYTVLPPARACQEGDTYGKKPGVVTHVFKDGQWWPVDE